LANADCPIDWFRLEQFVEDKLRLSYKDWPQTSEWADQLLALIGDPFDGNGHFQQIYSRVLFDGNLESALTAAEGRNFDISKDYFDISALDKRLNARVING
jgi:hypothetical protein